MKIGKTLAFIGLVCLVLSACKKDGSSDSALTILVNGKWQMSAATGTISGVPFPINFYDSIPACAKDNFYTFAANGTATIDEGATKCDPSDPQTTTGNWELLSNNTKLKTIEPLTNTQATLNLISINSTSFQVQDTATIDFAGTPVTINATVTFKNIK